jgi:PemK-like, MazF-like toxin of type II toxin-antitoxin system
VVGSVAAGRAHDYDGPVTVAYAPRHDGEPDPGEVVWTWVPFEEDATKGKDRPVVVMGRPAGGPTDQLAVLMLSSKDHHDDPRWLVVGSGAWDPEGRVSSVRLDRVLAVAADAVRREGSALERDRFDRIATALCADHGWQA